MIRDIYIKGYAGSTPAGWQRPADWLTMPTVVDTDQTFVGLHAVFPSGNNFAAFEFTTDTGDYEVDWGDGTVDLVNSNVNAEHQYDFATYDTGNTTLTSRGYKQAMITVTPVSGDLLTCNFQQRYVTVPAQTTAYSTGFLDCILSMPNANTGGSIVFGGTTVRHTYVERFELLNSGSVTIMSGMFQSCFSLQSIPLLDTSNVTNMAGMFQSCNSLQSIPLLDTSNVTNMAQMFSGCSSLQQIPLLDTSNVTSMTQMFATCSSLQQIPLLDTANVTSMTNMFLSCRSLQEIPLLDTSNVTSMVNMFRDCSSLQSIPALSTAAITTDFTTFAINSSSLNRCQMSFARTVTFQNCQLSRDAIVEIFNNLAVVVSATITITGNWGASALTTTEREIATDKNWTITG